MDDEIPRVIEKPDITKSAPENGEKGVRWSERADGYISETAKKVEGIKVVCRNEEENDKEEILKHYYADRYEQVFDEWDSVRDSASIVNSDALGVAVIIKSRKGKAGSDKYKNQLEPGFYKATNSRQFGLKIQPTPSIHQDDYIDLEVGVDELKKDMNLFFSNKSVFEEKGMIKKRSFLLYGPPGTGKTFNTIYTCKQLIDDHNVAVIMLAPNTDFVSLSKDFKEPLREQNVVFIIEELTEIEHKKEQVLSFLDGEYSWENTYVVGTTNFPEKLDKNIIDRPGRFDRIKKIGIPEYKARKKYLENVADQEFSKEEIKQTKGYSFSYLREIALRMELYDVSLGEVVEEFDKIKREIDNQFEDRDRMGVV